MQPPKISVITPSFNQGQFIEQTILSVLSQHYPVLEYIIMDGGSTDNTVPIIKKYEKYIAYWQSKRDKGQAAAINEGMKMATGNILCWINSDDMYMPGIFDKVADFFTDQERPQIVFGNCLHFHNDSSKTRGSAVTRSQQKYRLSLCDYVIQPSSFWNKAAWYQVGSLNENFHFAFDWDWFIRADKAGIPLLPVAEYLSLYRVHDQHKSGIGGANRIEELRQVVALYNDKKLSKAFNRWMRIYSRDGYFSKIMDVSQRFDISFINGLFRRLLFPSLSAVEYQSIVAMK